MKINLYRKWNSRGIKESKGSWTETEAMDEAGYIRIYDAGQMKWVKNM